MINLFEMALFRLDLLIYCNGPFMIFLLWIFNMVSFFIICVNCSVGIPYKEAVTGFCDELHPLAQVGLFFMSNFEIILRFYSCTLLCICFI